MNYRKCYAKQFDEPLKAHGFRRKGVVFYRLNNDILQSIALKNINPYFIHIGFYPYWMHNLIHDPFAQRLDKHYWAEGGALRISGSYHTSEEEASAEMEICMQKICDIIPYLDGICDEDSYLKAVMDWNALPPLNENGDIIFSMDFTGEIKGLLYPDQYSLLWKACREGSYAGAMEILRSATEVYKAGSTRGAMWSKRLVGLDEKELWVQQETEAFLRRKYHFFLEKAKVNDFSWIKELHDSETEKMKIQLRAKLKLDVL